MVNATPQYPLDRKLGGPQGQSEQVRKNSPPHGFDPRTVQPVGSRYINYAIPVFLGKLLKKEKLIERTNESFYGSRPVVFISKKPHLVLTQHRFLKTDLPFQILVTIDGIILTGNNNLYGSHPIVFIAKQTILLIPTQHRCG